MLSKEEIEKAKKFMKFYKNHCLNREMTNIENYETVNDGEFIYKNIETLLQYIDQLEFQIQAKEKEHKYDVNIIDEVKGEAVKLYKEINKQNKIIDKMANIIKDYDIDYSDICKHRIVRSCPEAPKSCKECVKQYFEKKVNKSNG